MIETCENCMFAKLHKYYWNYYYTLVCGRKQATIETYIPSRDYLKKIPTPSWCPLQNEKTIVY